MSVPLIGAKRRAVVLELLRVVLITVAVMLAANEEFVEFVYDKPVRDESVKSYPLVIVASFGCTPFNPTPITQKSKQ
jgi:hypothetical protein